MPPSDGLLRLQARALHAHHGLAVGEVRRVDEPDDPLVALHLRRYIRNVEA